MSVFLSTTFGFLAGLSSVAAYELWTGKIYFRRGWLDGRTYAMVVFGLTSLFLAIIFLWPVAAKAQQPTPEQRLVTDYNGLAGSLQAASAAFDHMKDGTRAILEQAAKDAAELRYWREYVAGLPKPPAPPQSN